MDGRAAAAAMMERRSAFFFFDKTAIGFDKGYRCSVLKGGVWVWWFWEVRVAGGVSVGAGRAWL
jgi:hypothetical protein